MGFALLYVPGLLVNPPLDRLVNGEADVAQLVSEARSGGAALAPVTDQAPYFFQFEVGLPSVLRPVAWAGLGLLLITLLLLVAQSGCATLSTAGGPSLSGTRLLTGFTPRFR